MVVASARLTLNSLLVRRTGCHSEGPFYWGRTLTERRRRRGRRRAGPAEKLEARPVSATPCGWGWRVCAARVGGGRLVRSSWVFSSVGSSGAAAGVVLTVDWNAACRAGCAIPGHNTGSLLLLRAGLPNVASPWLADCHPCQIHRCCQAFVLIHLHSVYLCMQDDDWNSACE